MGLFSNKKKGLPQFPKLPERPSFPEYKQQVPTPESFRKDISGFRVEEPEEFNIPMRRPEMPRPRPFPVREISPAFSPVSGSQPLFVKIDKYKAAISALNEVKQKLAEAEDTLSKLNAIKIRESDEIARWESEIQNIKEKLMAIDKDLFEV